MKIKMIEKKKVGIILAVILATLLLFAACSTATTAGEKTVEIGGIYSLTGGAGASVQIFSSGAQDYFRYFNEQEGIPGVSIKHLWGDTMGQYTQFYSWYEKFIARGIPVIFCEENLGLTALNERFAKDEVVMFGDAMGFQEMTYSPGWRYFTSATVAEQSAAVTKYFKENWKESRPPRFAFITIDVDWGKDPVAEGTRYAQSLGFEVLPPESVPFVVLDATTQLLRLREEGADFVYMQALPSAIGPALRDAERLELLGQIQFSGFGPSMGDMTIEMAGIASEGFLMSMVTPWFDETDNPGIKLMLDNQMKYRGKTVRDTAYINGWEQAAIACEAIKRAIENVGYDNLDGAAIKEALDNMKDFDAYGLASITYKDSPLDHRGNTKLAIYEVRDGKIVPMTDWQEAPTLVPEGLVRE